MKTLKQILALVLLSLVFLSEILGSPRVSITPPGAFNTVLANRSNNSFLSHLVQGKNIFDPAVAGASRGVLFQGVAEPTGNAGGKNIAISYNKNKEDGERFSIQIGNDTITSNLYDWELIPIAKFASDKEHFSCMTFYEGEANQKDDPDNYKEDDKLKKEYSNNKYPDSWWVAYHPAFGNTLIGLNLFYVDAMMIHPDRLRIITNNFPGEIKNYNDIKITGVLSEICSEIISSTLSTFSRSRPPYITYNTYNYSDYGIEITFDIADNNIVFNGVPIYQFSYLIKDLNGKVTEVIKTDKLNIKFKNRIELVKNINPMIYDTANKTAQWAAFFRYVREKNPTNWDKFISNFENVDVQDIEIPVNVNGKIEPFTFNTPRLFAIE
jgi:hypothetical protein